MLLLAEAELVTLVCCMQTRLEAAGGQQSTQLLRGHGPPFRSVQQGHHQTGLYCCCMVQVLCPRHVATADVCRHPETLDVAAWP